MEEDVKNWLVKILLPALVAVSMKLAVMVMKRGRITRVTVFVSFVTGVGSAYLCSGIIMSTFAPEYIAPVSGCIAIIGEKIVFSFMYKFNVEAVVLDIAETMLNKIKRGK